MWKTLFNEKPDIFNYNSGKDELSINFENIDRSSKSSYLNYLLNGCVKEDSGLFLLVNAKLFLDWIDADNHFSERRLRKIFMTIRNRLKNNPK